MAKHKQKQRKNRRNGSSSGKQGKRKRGGVRNTASGQITVATILKTTLEALGLLAVAWAMIKTLGDGGDGARLAALTAAVIVMLEVFDIVDQKRAPYVCRGALRRLVVAYLFRLTVIVCVAVVGFTTELTRWAGTGDLVIFLFAALELARVQRKICDRLPPEEKRRSTPLLSTHLVKLIGRVLARYQDFIPWDLIRRLRPDPAGPLGSARRAVTTTTLVIALTLVACSVVARGAEVVERITHHPPAAPVPSHGVPTAHVPAEIRRPADPSPRTDTQSEHEVSSSRQSTCARPPGSGAPRWARDDIRRLYLGGLGRRTGEAPGTKIAGCPTAYFTTDGRDGPFVYALGTSPSSASPLSVAVDGRFGPALFLAPAVEPVLALIHRFGAVGGMRRFTASSGPQFAPVLTDDGTYTLIRPETGTAQVARGYMELPPPVTDAWFGAMREIGTMRGVGLSWLTPSTPEPSGKNQVFTLYEGAAARYTITFNPWKQSAKRDGYTYHLPEPQLLETELEEAATAE
jgi:hypothetical protein